ncbi:MAG: SpoIID/LytB domain-containing protein [Nocardioides sp.]
MTRSPIRTGIALAAALTCGALALTDPPSHATGSDRSAAHAVAVSGAKLTIKGHGFGHGRGLSQYGARGAAEEGLSAKKILRFYYPHTKYGTKLDKIKVLITEDTDSKTVVRTHAGLKVRQVHGNLKYKLPTTGKFAKATEWRLSGGAGRIVHISYRTKSWHKWKSMPSDAEFYSKKPTRLVLPGGDVAYRGVLQSRIPPAEFSSLGRVTINELPLEQYVQGVVPQEMPALWPAAALQAQSVAARTYAAFEARHSVNKMWGVCDTSACQVYGGKGAETSMSNAAVAKTRGQILLYKGAPAFTQFTSSNGGWTAHLAGDPFLPAKKDIYEKHSGNPFHNWTVKSRVSKIQKAWPSLGRLKSVSIDKRDGHGQWGGRVLELTLHGSSGDVAFGYPDDPAQSVGLFTATLGLRSKWFTVTS